MNGRIEYLDRKKPESQEEITLNYLSQIKEQYYQYSMAQTAQMAQWHTGRMIRLVLGAKP